jgi:hypothetical protein
MELDIVYNPGLWLLLNIAVAAAILTIRRRMRGAPQASPESLEAGPYWRLERLLRSEVPPERQREYLKECMVTIISIMADKGMVSDLRPMTVREVFSRLGREEVEAIIQKYEEVRFGGRILSTEELEDFRSKLRALARSVIF